METKYFIMYLLLNIPYVFFIHYYLEPNFKSPWSDVLFFLAQTVFSIFIILYYYENILLKAPSIVLFIFFCELCLYKGTILKKAIGAILTISISILSELPIDFVLVYILDLKIDTLLTSDFFIYIQILNVILTSLLYSIVLFFSSQKSLNLKKQTTGLLIVIICFFLLSWCIATIQFSDLIELSFIMKLKIMIFFTCCSSIFNFVLLVYLHKLYEEAKFKYNLQKLEREYQMSLATYKNESNQIYTYLRHDISNYILSYHQESSQK